uniref:ubiquitin carboxyl-terminal hydrolase 37-like n=1 Tax=Scatophagus argus TaxID=75038 RepID=UPI001ED7EC1B|nr:ubiquitin carboxyl-terminal hydrolase 37-like [Scatophagus argus]
MEEMKEMDEMDNTEEMQFTDAINMLLDESIQITDNSVLDNELTEQLLLQQLLFTMFSNSNTTNQSTEVVQSRTVDPFGFPNIGQSCYMNSSLQSILALEDFVRDISRMEQVWSSVPQGNLMRSLMKIRDVHASTDPKIKSSLLHSFKKTISIQAPEFRDNQQKDAHEFLTAVFSQMRSLGPLLKETAALKGISYTCPVEDHLVFSMDSTRTCKSCGSQSASQEEFCNLSLDLISGGSIEQMLEGYLKETDLEFKCECGGTSSGQTLSFATLPRVLILHLKRFCFTPSHTLEKIQDPVQLLSHLKVSCKQDVGFYSLVSVINHFGVSRTGHYVCDGICPDSPDDEHNRWLTFNDSMVHKTTSTSVCIEQDAEGGASEGPEPKT